MTGGKMQIQTERNGRKETEERVPLQGQAWEVTGGLEFSNGGFSWWVAFSDSKGHVSLNIRPNRSHHHSQKSKPQLHTYLCTGLETSTDSTKDRNVFKKLRRISYENIWIYINND